MAGKPNDKAEAGKRKPKKKSRKGIGGAKSKYDENFPALAEGYARRGMTDKAIAEALGISQDTFYRFIKQFPEFSEGIRVGRRPHDIDVENSLLMSAKGYFKDIVKQEKFKDSDGKTHVKEVVEKRWFPPSFNAAVFWLKNRLPDLWRENQDKDNDNTDLPILTVEEIGQDERPDGSTIDEDLQ
jgi:hypothetical protein